MDKDLYLPSSIAVHLFDYIERIQKAKDCLLPLLSFLFLRMWIDIPGYHNTITNLLLEKFGEAVGKVEVEKLETFNRLETLNSIPASVHQETLLGTFLFARTKYLTFTFTREEIYFGTRFRSFSPCLAGLNTEMTLQKGLDRGKLLTLWQPGNMEKREEPGREINPSGSHPPNDGPPTRSGLLRHIG